MTSLSGESSTRNCFEYVAKSLGLPFGFNGPPQGLVDNLFPVAAEPTTAQVLMVIRDERKWGGPANEVHHMALVVGGLPFMVREVSGLGKEPVTIPVEAALAPYPPGEGFVPVYCNVNLSFL